MKSFLCVECFHINTVYFSDLSPRRTFLMGKHSTNKKLTIRKFLFKIILASCVLKVTLQNCEMCVYCCMLISSGTNVSTNSSSIKILFIYIPSSGNHLLTPSYLPNLRHFSIFCPNFYSSWFGHTVTSVTELSVWKRSIALLTTLMSLTLPWPCRIGDFSCVRC